MINPKKESKAMKGRVPKPKAIIKPQPFITDPAANEPAMAKYTIPQGNRPFKMPMNNKFFSFLFCNNLPKYCCIQ